ncbi:hypothetical protein H8959_021543 [Pygathrix nigripes]
MAAIYICLRFHTVAPGRSDFTIFAPTRIFPGEFNAVLFHSYIQFFHFQFLPPIRTDGTRVTSRKSAKYKLQGTIQRGNVSLTILNPSEGDSGMYCCRIEVPGWFNDVKINMRLNLQRASTTTRRTTTTTHRTTTTSPPTTPHVTTTIAALPTTVVTTPDLTSGTPLQTTTTAVFTTANTCPSPTPSTLPEAATGLLTPEPSKEGPIPTAESETVLPNDSWSSAESPADTVLLTSRESKVWDLPPTSHVSMWKTSDSVSSPQPGVQQGNKRPPQPAPN